MAQNKAKLRSVLRSSLANKKKADELADAVIELQNKLNALLVKLDSDTGVTDVDYGSTLTTSKIEE
jgi:hypothetical protein